MVCAGYYNVPFVFGFENNERSTETVKLTMEKNGLVIFTVYLDNMVISTGH
jgi:hypothetical protein